MITILVAQKCKVEEKIIKSKGHEAYLVTFDQNFKNDSNEFSEENDL